MFPIMGATNPTGYNLTRSLRFRSSASASLSRTPASAGNRKTWTWSAWVKRGSLSSNQVLFISKPSATSDATFTTIGFSSSNTLLVSGYSVQWRNTTQVFRDPSAWYHIVVTWDTTQATATNRVKVYVNGSQVTAFGTTFDPSLNFDGAINQADAHYFCYPDGYSYSYFDGYLTEVNFVDGQGLTPSSFGETDTITGVWKPKRYAGTYGTNGFYLPFTDNSALTTSSNAGLGKDFSGNGNYWTTNNISITAGTTCDSMTDVPTLTSATAANFCVWNSADPSLMAGGSRTISNGNLTVSDASTSYGLAARGTFWQSSGKWYWEINCTSIGDVYGNLGFCDASNNGVFYQSSGQRNPAAVNTGTTSYGASYTTGDVIGVALDLNANSVTFYKNNVSQGAVSFSAGTYTPAVGDGSNGSSYTWDANFGQRPFAFSPPTGYVALNTYNLPTSTIVKGNTVMDATLWTGNGTTQTITNSAGFKPDFVWLKSRGATYISNNNNLFDSVRGANKALFSDLTNAEITYTDRMNSFNSNGFTVASGYNANNGTFVGWQWQAGQGTTSSNTSGSITSTVSVNASAGFSVVTATSPASGNAFTLGHGLGVAPQFIISKSRSGSGNWSMYHRSTGAGGYLLFTTAAYTANTDTWNNTTPTSSLISTTTNWWGNSANLVFYCWTPIAGFSAFGSYTGNGSSDGTFVYTGFRPKFVMIKEITSGGTNWNILDTSRDPYNVEQKYLAANLSDAEGTLALLDGLSNGFKLRSSGLAVNASGSTYIYMAFAENPFKNSLAR